MIRNKTSVIIPTLNAQEHIGSCLQSIRQASHDVEIIISDGGSSDQTIPIVQEFNVKVIKAPKGRGIQLNQGAKAASGDLLAFFHADTTLPVNTFEMLNAFFADSQVQISKFRMKFDEKHFLFSLYSWMTRFNSLWTRFGDQGIIVRRSFFDQLDGFYDWPLFEDVDFFKRAASQTTIWTLPIFLVTSARRFKENGYLRQQIKNGWLITQYLRGVSPDELYKKYYS